MIPNFPPSWPLICRRPSIETDWQSELFTDAFFHLPDETGWRSYRKRALSLAELVAVKAPGWLGSGFEPYLEHSTAAGSPARRAAQGKHQPHYSAQSSHISCHRTVK